METDASESAQMSLLTPRFEKEVHWVQVFLCLL